MTIEQVIAETDDGPATVESLARDFGALGVEPGMTLLVHSSLSALGYVSGGPVAVVLALQQALGPDGTLVMPTHSSDLSDPAGWENPPVPEFWWEPIRQSMPAYRTDMTPCWFMGAIPECFRGQQEVQRSDHPIYSFAARGPQAAAIVDAHSLAYGLGEGSPLARIYDRNGWVLLLGVGHDSNTSLHLAEYRADFPGKRDVTQAAPVLIEGARTWTTYPDIDLDESDFARIGATFEDEIGLVRRGHVAQAESRLLPQRALVDFAVQWMERHRGGNSLKCSRWG